MKIAVVGNGKMGQMIASLCAKDPEFEVAGLVGPGDRESLAEIPEADVIVDFSYPGNMDMILERAEKDGIPAVIGTTGLSDEQEEKIRQASGKVAIVREKNFSTGVTVLCRLARMAAEALGEDFDIEIVETHHNQKADAPSGTAQLLLHSVDTDGSFAVVNGRKGNTGKRGKEIGIHSLRGGTVAGEHSVKFFGHMEEIELRHRADSREIFASGALKAVLFAAKAAPGLYSMEDILFGGK